MKLFKDKRFVIGFGLLLIGALGLSLWGLVIEPRRLRVNEQALNLPGWPADLDGMRVALLSDLHVGSPHVSLNKLKEIVRRTNELQPDMVVLAGDFVVDNVFGGAFVELELIEQELGMLQSRHGT